MADKSATDKSRGRRRPKASAVQFTAQQLQYSLEEFWVPSCDTRGHSVREMVRMVPDAVGAMDLILARKAFPYQTRSEIVRHAVARHIAWLHELEPSMPRTYLATMQACMLILSQDQHKAASEALFKTLFGRVEDHMVCGETGEAVRLLHEIKSQLRASADTPWKRRALARFARQYQPFLTPGAVVDAAFAEPRLLAAAPAGDAGAGAEGGAGADGGADGDEPYFMEGHDD